MALYNNNMIYCFKLPESWILLTHNILNKNTTLPRIAFTSKVCRNGIDTISFAGYQQSSGHGACTCDNQPYHYIIRCHYWTNSRISLYKLLFIAFSTDLSLTVASFSFYSAEKVEKYFPSIIDWLLNPFDCVAYQINGAALLLFSKCKMIFAVSKLAIKSDMKQFYMVIQLKQRSYHEWHPVRNSVAMFLLYKAYFSLPV